MSKLENIIWNIQFYFYLAWYKLLTPNSKKRRYELLAFSDEPSQFKYKTRRSLIDTLKENWKLGFFSYSIRKRRNRNLFLVNYNNPYSTYRQFEFDIDKEKFFLNGKYNNEMATRIVEQRIQIEIGRQYIKEEK